MAYTGVAICVAVMLVSVAVLIGFKSEIQRKLTASASDINLTPFSLQDNNDASLPIENKLLKSFKNIEGINAWHPYGENPGIIELNGSIKGVAIMALPLPQLQQQLAPFLIDSLPNKKAGVFISKRQAQLGELSVGDEIQLYFTSNNLKLKPRKMRISGIFHTGIDQIDQQSVFITLPDFQKIKKWGAVPYITGQKVGELWKVSCGSTGEVKENQFQWLTPKSTSRQLTLTEQEISRGITLAFLDNNHFADTIHIETSAFFTQEEILMNGKGTHHQYASGIAFTVTNKQNIKPIARALEHKTGFIYEVKTIQEQSPEIFNWLEILNNNVYIILIIMTVVAVISMSSTLLILILEKTETIGMMKVLGANQKLLRHIFLWNAIYILGIGLVIGNLIAALAIWGQSTFKWVTLPETEYFLDYVPVQVNMDAWLSINLGCVLVCTFILILPTYLASRIKPAAVLRFE